MDTELAPEVLFCSQCGKASEPASLARFGDVLVCADCKNAYAQRLREGASTVSPLARSNGGFWRRTAALLIDGIILFVIQMAVMFAISPVFRPTELRPGDPTGALATGLLVYVLSIGMSALYEGFAVHKYAATPGKMVMGLEVVRTDGSPLSLGRSFGRHFAKYLSSIILCIGYLMVAFDSRKRGLHDMICDTQVVMTR